MTLVSTERSGVTGRISPLTGPDVMSRRAEACRS
jgi:hypothetical protein